MGLHSFSIIRFVSLLLVFVAQLRTAVCYCWPGGLDESNPDDYCCWGQADVYKQYCTDLYHTLVPDQIYDYIYQQESGPQYGCYMTYGCAVGGGPQYNGAYFIRVNAPVINTCSGAAGLTNTYHKTSDGRDVVCSFEFSGFNVTTSSTTMAQTTTTTTTTTKLPTTTTTTTTRTTTKTTTTTTTTKLPPTSPTTTTVKPPSSTTTKTGGAGSGSSSSTTKPTTSRASTLTTTSGTTAGAGANPTVTSAYSTAVSSANAATSAVNSYTANPTDSALANAANTAVVSALIAVQSAAEVAAIAAAAAAVAEPVADALAVNAAADAAYAAAAAVLELTPAAAANLNAAAAAAAAAALQASSANAKSTSSRPTTTATTSTTTTSSASSCVACVACGDSSVPTYTSEEVPIPTTSGTAKRSTRDLFSRNVNDREAMVCGRPVSVPSYQSWSPVSAPYSPIFNYYIGGNQARCDGTYNWKLISANTAAGLETAPAGSTTGRNSYVSEHIYEIQEIKIFLLHAARNVDAFSQYSSTTLRSITDGSAAFCTDIVLPLFFNTNQWAATSFYGNGGLSAIQDIYNNLENSNSDFVHLEADLNGLKRDLFGSSYGSGLLSEDGIQTYNVYLRNYALMARVSLLVQYLNDDRVTTIYKRVSQRISDAFVKFGNACKSSSSSRYKALANIDWAAEYKKWDESYLDGIELNMETYILAANTRSEILIRALEARGTLSMTEKQYVDTLIQNARNARATGALSGGAILLDKLKL